MICVSLLCKSKGVGVCVPCLSSGVSTWKVRSMTVVHCRQRMMNVLGLGRSVFINWHSDHTQGEKEGRQREGPVCREAEGRDRPTVTAIYLYSQPNRLLRNPRPQKNRCALKKENPTDLVSPFKM